MKERLRTSDYRFIAVCLLLFAGAAWYSVRNFYRAFPEASIDFRVGRDDAQVLAGRFLAGQGYQVEGYRQASRFSFDDEAKTFLEREAGLEQANRLMGTRVRLWRWEYRWFRPQQKEEYGVAFTPGGELAGFRHEIPEEAARPAATAEQARALAEEFLRSRLHRDAARLEFVEESDQTRPHRVDREFTWKERDFNLHDATNRMTVTVLGDEVGGYREYLKIPEQWTRDYQRLRSKNEMAQMVDSALLVALMLGLVVVIVMRVRRQDVRWRRAAVVGLVGMALSLCASLNQFPLNEFGYPTTDSYGSFLSQQFLEALLSALGSGGLLFVLIAGAETLYREALPTQISLGNLFRPRGLRTKRFFLGVILGITLAGIFIAYQTAFYIVAYRFGAWSPAEVPYDNLLNTRFPWLFVLFFGFFPAVSEEGLFRMFAIPLLHKLVRYLPVAVVLAAFIWGFGHAGYPQQPFYIRGLEVGIGGVALGLVMLRWGILPTLVWHYSVDAGYTAMLLVRSHNLYFRLSGAASAGIIVLPLVVALVAYWRRGGFEPEGGLLNADESAAAVEEPVEAAPAGSPTGLAATMEYRPLSNRVRVAAVAIFAAGLLSLLIPVSRFGESPKYKIPAEQARAGADAFLKQQGLDAGGFRHLTYPATHWSGGDSLAGKYFLERRPVSVVSRLFERYRPVEHWLTRYFKSLDKEEITVSEHPETGKVIGFTHTIPEDRPGADVPVDQARQIASAFAAAEGWDLAAMELKEVTSEKKKARTDWVLEWEARAGDPRNLDEAHYRVHVDVAGDRVSSLRSYWKIPETYERGRDRQNALSIMAMALRIGAIAAGIVYALWLLIQATRKGLVRWGGAIRLAVPATLLFVLAWLLSFELMLKSYDTAIPLETYQAVLYITLLMSAIFMFLILGAAAALVALFYPESMGALRAANRGLLGLDAIAALLAAAGLWVLLNQHDAMLMDHHHAQALFAIGSPDLIVSRAPALAAVAGAARSLLMNAATLALIAIIVKKLPKRWMLAPLALAALTVNLSGDIRTPGEFALEYAMAAIWAGCAVLFCLSFARKNYLAYALVLWAMALRPAIAELFGNGNPALERQAWMVAAVLAVSVIWAVAPALRRRANT
jgi:membrane protease YdiL (CAAX protease family)